MFFTKNKTYIRKANFGKVNTKALFAAVDIDNNGEIEYDEWMEFWSNVKKAGYNEKDILNEVYLYLFYLFLKDIKIRRRKILG